MKIIGKIIAVQNARQGEGVNGTWYSRDYVIEDETHPGEGVVVSTFNTSIIQAAMDARGIQRPRLR